MITKLSKPENPLKNDNNVYIRTPHLFMKKTMSDFNPIDVESAPYISFSNGQVYSKRKIGNYTISRIINSRESKYKDLFKNRSYRQVIPFKNQSFFRNKCPFRWFVYGVYNRPEYYTIKDYNEWDI